MLGGIFALCACQASCAREFIQGAADRISRFQLARSTMARKWFGLGMAFEIGQRLRLADTGFQPGHFTLEGIEASALALA
ncbi:hypothetical protein BGCPKDLD_5253 [Methylorubrum suomiense]|uniref:Uncharacterized protein n=1 Tax=Methylorubrum suomiense TaxID=144191 RepID=A0ABQ4V2X9_9HYPH|nr:hypothetical protein BGCPKDLD_5253 [Methylorubrum suomiense]